MSAFKIRGEQELQVTKTRVLKVGGVIYFLGLAFDESFADRRYHLHCTYTQIMMHMYCISPICKYKIVTIQIEAVAACGFGPKNGLKVHLESPR